MCRISGCASLTFFHLRKFAGSAGLAPHFYEYNTAKRPQKLPSTRRELFDRAEGTLVSEILDALLAQGLTDNSGRIWLP